VTLEQAEVVLRLAAVGVDIWACWGPDVWYEALAVVMAERAPA